MATAVDNPGLMATHSLLRLSLTVLAMLTCWAPATEATTVIPVDLQYCVRRAGFVFAGTVTGMKSARLDQTIVTHVDLSDVTYAKGKSRRERIRITYEGGILDSVRVFSAGQPGFSVGSRYILMAHEDLGAKGPWYIPIVGVYQGFFQVVRDGKSSRVLDWVDRPVVGVEGRRLVVVSTGTSNRSHSASLVRVLPRDEDTGVRMTEREFLEVVRGIAAQPSD